MCAWRENLLANLLASKRADIAIVTLSPVKVALDFSTANDFQPLIFCAGGATSLNEGVIAAIDMIAARKQVHRKNNIPYYRPEILLITDGVLDDSWQKSSSLIKAGETAKAFSFTSVSVQNAEFTILNQISLRPLVALKELIFTDLFV